MNPSDPSNSGLLIFGIVAIPFLIIAVILAVIILRSRGKARASRNWSRTTGRVIVSKVERRQSRTSSGGYNTAYYPVVEYEYTVNGQRYQTTRVRFGTQVGWGRPERAQNAVDQHPAGSMVQVFYDPADPAEAVLEQASSSASQWLGCIIIGIIAIVVMVAIFTLVEGSLLSLVAGDLPQ